MADSRKNVKTKGVLLIAFGKTGYGFAAYNMATSIKKFNHHLPVTLLADDIALKYLEKWMLSAFDSIIKIDGDDYTHEGKFEPAKVKCQIYKYLPYDETLYLDVDGCALQDITPLIDKLSDVDKYFQTDVISLGYKGDALSYSWAPNDAIWQHFKLKEEQIYYSVQSSYIFVKKGKQAEALFSKIESNFLKNVFPLNKLRFKWGGSMPDELITGATCSQLNYDPRNGLSPIFFGAKFDPRTFTQIENDYYVLSIHGNGTGSTLTKLKYIEWYDKLMKNVSKYSFKSNSIMKDKHANKRQ